MATLPPKPGSGRVRAHVQRISLGVSAKTPDGRRQIKALQKRLEHEVLAGTFDWGNWSREHRPKSELTIAELVAGLEQHLGATKALEPSTWKNAYQGVYNLRFPRQDEPLTVEKVVGALAASDRTSGVRKRDYTAMAALVKFAELEVDLTPYRSGYSQKQVKPQDLPSDEQLVALVDSLEPRQLQWAVGMLVTYGLRPSELVELDLSEFPTVRVSDTRKTGGRAVLPLLEVWADRWDLADKPILSWNLEHAQGISHNLRMLLKRRGWNFTRYAFRHCWARRCASKGISASVAARLMGHSPEIHERTYRAWISESEWLGMFREQTK